MAKEPIITKLPPDPRIAAYWKVPPKPHGHAVRKFGTLSKSERAKRKGSGGMRRT